jgi:tetratricopeptide (TPR) repeat protein
VQLDAWRVASLVTLGRNDEAAALTERLLARPGLPAAPRCTLLSARTRLANERGDFAAAAQHAEAALRAAEEAALPVATMRCLQNLGAVAHTRGDTPASRAAFSRMLSLADEHGAELQRARALRGLAVLAQGEGDAARALALLDDALARFAALGDQVEIAQAERSRSFVLRDLGRHAGQRAAAEAAVAAAQALGWPHQLAPNLFALALAQEDMDDGAAAAVTYRRCLRLARRHAMTPLVLRCVFGLAALEAAADTLARSDALALLLWTRAHPALRRGDVEEVDARLAALAPTPAEQAAAQAAASSLTLDAVLLRWPA